MEKFSLGCNYWASNAGVHMWRCWDETAVEEDLKRLSQMGIDTLRVFPLWTDFQPLTCHMGTSRREMRINDIPLDDSPEGIAGVDPVMIERFERLVKIANKYGLKLLVCIINGWMSGKMFFPPAFANLCPITDPVCIRWTVRFVKYFVEHFKSFDNIVAWEAGNESNVMTMIKGMKCSGDAYSVWLGNIVNTIKSVDNSRPVIAGMHGLVINGEVSPADVGELCDVMTVHPYPAFVPHCYVESLSSMKSRLHATAEGVLYSDIAGKPCLCEEIGTLGNMLGSNRKGADYLKVNTYSLWANSSTGLMWWCSHDQDKFSFAPYDWCGLERELGLMYSDGEYKETALEIQSLREFVDKNDSLPERNRDAVCILSRDQDCWAVAYSAFVLAKQAGVELKFADADKKIPDSKIYMLPSVCGECLPHRTQIELLKRVHDDGAVLYISWNNGFISQLEEIAGIEIIGNSLRNGESTVTLENGITMPLNAERKLIFEPRGATVLASEADNSPALTVNRYGKGKIYFLAFAPELTLVDRKDSFECNNDREYYRLYDYILKPHTNSIVRTKSSPFVGITEHHMPDGTTRIVAVNYIDEPIKCSITLEKKQFKNTVYGTAEAIGEGVILNLRAGDICIIEVE